MPPNKARTWIVMRSTLMSLAVLAAALHTRAAAEPCSPTDARSPTFGVVLLIEIAESASKKSCEESPEARRYLDELADRARESWKRPIQFEMFPMAAVRFRVGPAGELLQFSVAEASAPDVAECASNALRSAAVSVPSKPSCLANLWLTASFLIPWNLPPVHRVVPLDTVPVSVSTFRLEDLPPRSPPKWWEFWKR